MAISKVLKDILSIYKPSQKAVIIDATPLTLFLVGAVNSSLIERCNRVKSIFTKEHYDQLYEFTSHFNKIIITPYILTEVSHHIIEDRKFPLKEKECIIDIINTLANNKKIEISESNSDKLLKRKKYICTEGVADTSLLDFDDKIPILTSEGVYADTIRKKEGKIVVKFIPHNGLVAY